VLTLRVFPLPDLLLLIPNTREWNIVSNFCTYDGEQEPRARLYIDIACSVVYLTLCTKRDAVYEGCAVESTWRMRGWARKMERGAIDHVKTKSWYFSWCVKVSILVEFLQLCCLSLYVELMDVCKCRVTVLRKWSQSIKIIYLANGKKEIDSIYPIKSTRFVVLFL